MYKHSLHKPTDKRLVLMFLTRLLTTLAHLYNVVGCKTLSLSTGDAFAAASTVSASNHSQELGAQKAKKRKSGQDAKLFTFAARNTMVANLCYAHPLDRF